MDQAHDLSPGLLRQRRNLTLTSATLLFLSFAEAEIHSFQILGISASFGRPEAIVFGLTGMAFYFLYRYGLYLRQEPAFGLRSEFYRRLNRYSKPKIVNLRDHKYPAGKGLELAEELGVRKAGTLSWEIQVGSQKDGQGGYRTNDLVVSLKDVWWEAIKAGFVAVLARSYFTDYVFPFLLAAAALFVTFR